jgi:hypothetical protein
VTAEAMGWVPAGLQLLLFASSMNIMNGGDVSLHGDSAACRLLGGHRGRVDGPL